ncbi:TetR/AcrR family transcriptional regulator [Mesorhizobium sp. INR15]|uniref:TetR/AcrR family transcriptional regulator n=1 Tax=Mesorhizobium sp. INR15 TaxID=2654248 RepID=UPI0018968D2A|nr:TetR/AcrR family transcriptional regulator [Mesorhizobium sp. INR15]QPC90956.1 TetR family transcriptional regulator [Mesorhizobium sp. INR15]
MDRTATRPLTAKGAATRARIVETAANLVFFGGAGATSLDDVMAACGASKSQMYHYFADREGLIGEVIKLQTSRVLAGQRYYLESLDSLPALRRWRDAIVEMNKAGGGLGGCPLGSLANELADRSENSRSLLLGSFEAWSIEIQRSLERMREQGKIDALVNTHDLATAALCAVQGGLLLAKTSRSMRPLEIALDMAVAHIARHLL